MKSFFLFLTTLFSISVFCHNTSHPISLNQGQWKGEFKVKVKHSSYTMFLNDKDTWTYVFKDKNKIQKLHENIENIDDPSLNEVDHFAYSMTFLEGNLSNYELHNKSNHYSNYFIGNDKSSWKSYIYSYREIYYTDVWKNIDIRLYLHDNGQMKYDFIVNPGGDVSNIRLKYKGTDCIKIEKGKVNLGLSFNELIEEIPVAYSIENKTLINHITQNIESSFFMEEDIVKIKVASYDKSKILVIDPTLVFASASGSSGDNWGICATYDYLGNTYGGALVQDPGFPTTLGSFMQSFPGFNDIGINKLSNDGSTLLWSSYLGSSQWLDIPLSLICNSDNDLYVMGRSKGNNFPTLSNSYQSTIGGEWDIVVGKLSEDGSSLLASTYFGGSANEVATSSPDARLHSTDFSKGEIQLDWQENVIVVSTTKSSDLNIVDPNLSSLSSSNSDAIALRFSSDLSTLMNSKLLGGSNYEIGFGIVSSLDSNIYVVGNSSSSDFPTTSASHRPTLIHSNHLNGFVVKLDDSFNIVNSSYLESQSGTSNFNKATGAYFVDIDDNDRPVVCGIDRNFSYQAINGGIDEGSGLVYFSTYSNNLGTVEKRGCFGGAPGPNSHLISLSSFEVDVCGNIYFSSFYNRTFPTSLDSLPTTLTTNSNDNTYYLGIIKNDSLYYGTYYYGDHMDGGTCRFDPNGNIHQALCVKDYFVVTPGAVFDNSALSGFDLKLMKFDLELIRGSVKIDTNGIGNNILGCINDSLQLSLVPNSQNTENIDWFVNGVIIDTGMFCNILMDSVGSYFVEAIRSDSACLNNNSDSLWIHIIDIIPDFIGDTLLCVGQNGEYTDNTIIPAGSISTLGITYNWSFGDGEMGTGSQITHEYDSSGVYDITLEVETPLCSYKTTKPVYVNVVELDVDFLSEQKICVGEQIEFTSNLTVPTDIINLGVQYQWDFGDGNSSGEKNPVHTYQNTGNYYVSLTIKVGDCEYTELKPNHIEIYDFQADFTTSYDSLTFPFDEDLIANPVESDYDSIVWIIRDQTFTDLDELKYHLKTESKSEEVAITLKLYKGNCKAQSTKEVILYNNESYWIPNAFTPNGDGINEQFIPEGRLIENSTIFRFAIYSRWGEQVFYSEDNTVGWFGVNKRGQLVKSDMYVWTLEVYSKVEGLIVDKGFVELIK